MTNKQFLKSLNARKSALAAERDKLRDFIAEAEELSESCDRAIECLEGASDALSEFV